MGCDGGTIPRRDELVRMKKKPEQKDKDADRTFKWRNCALSQQSLQEPIVACGLGRLYSKSSVLEALLDKDTKPDVISHIKSLKDIKDLKLTKNPAYVETDKTGGSVDDLTSPYICPVMGLEMTGKFRFIFIWSCGCVFAERALKEIKLNICHKCQQPFTNEDIVVLNGTDEDLIKMQANMEVRVASRKANKKSKGEKNGIQTKNGTKSESTSASPKAGTNKDSLTVSNDSKPSCSKTEVDVKPSKDAADIKPSKDAADVKPEFETIPLGLPKLEKRPVARGHFGSQKRAFTSQVMEDPSYKKTKKNYSVASDPKATEVYKSLFTTHESEKKQTRAHWVTYNPLYN